MARRHMRATRGIKNNVWTVVLQNELVLAASAQHESPIVTEADWSDGGERATCLTMRGYLSVAGSTQTAVAQTEGGILWYIGVVDRDIPAGSAPAPQTAATYVQNQIFTTGGHIFPAVAIEVTRDTYDVEIDVKTKRTIQAGQDITLVLANRTSDEVKLTLVIRALLRKGGN